ncbi:DUF2493 domain-containing protein [Cetobacterium sp.]|uniref:DUF2493 domain-containing protein n=1 Tax=Cetobacterium sp. TaxID=2071632 RepID=UPI003F38FAA5
MKILVCGGRDFKDKLLLEKTLSAAFNPNDILISGGAIGADKLAENFAIKKNIEAKIFYPQYKTWGKIAPLMRNSEMIKECDEVIAFWDRKSRGTKYTIENSIKNNKKVNIIEY